MIMAILLIRQTDRACRSSENFAPRNGFGSSEIAREWCGKASPVEQEMDDSEDFERYRDVATIMLTLAAGKQRYHHSCR
jgi:hypothetical protein